MTEEDFDKEFNNDLKQIHFILKKIIVPANKNKPIKEANKYDMNYLMEETSIFDNQVMDIYVGVLITKYLEAITNLRLPQNITVNFEHVDTKLEEVTDNYLVDYIEPVAIDLIYKAIGRNQRSLILPLKLNHILMYSIPFTIKAKELNKSVWHLLLFIAICYHDYYTKDNLF